MFLHFKKKYYNLPFLSLSDYLLIFTTDYFKNVFESDS